MYNPLHPAKNMDLRQIVYEKIKAAIVGGIIKPGEKLSEVELAEKMDVSRTPVREAIRQLAKTSLVTLAPRKGAYVSLPSISDASALYELREELEKCRIANLYAGTGTQAATFTPLDGNYGTAKASVAVTVGAAAQSPTKPVKAAWSLSAFSGSVHWVKNSWGASSR